MIFHSDVDLLNLTFNQPKGETFISSKWIRFQILFSLKILRRSRWRSSRSCRLDSTMKRPISIIISITSKLTKPAKSQNMLVMSVKVSSSGQFKNVWVFSSLVELLSSSYKLGRCDRKLKIRITLEYAYRSISAPVFIQFYTFENLLKITFS